MKGLFGGYREEVVKLFDSPSETREGGFNLVSSGRSSINVGGEYRLLSVAGYQARFLSREGICGVVVNGGESFLGWAMQGTATCVKVNSLTLAEFTYAFCRFVQSVQALAAPMPKRLRYYIELAGYDENNVALSLPKSRVSQARIVGSFPPTAIGQTNRSISTEVSFSAPPEENGLKLLQELYVRSGLESDAVPYSDSQKSRLDLEAINGGL